MSQVVSKNNRNWKTTKYVKRLKLVIRQTSSYDPELNIYQLVVW